MNSPTARGASQGESVEFQGAVAQLGERGLCKPEVIGSIPFSSTSSRSLEELAAARDRCPDGRLADRVGPRSRPVR